MRANGKPHIYWSACHPDYAYCCFAAGYSGRGPTPGFAYRMWASKALGPSTYRMTRVIMRDQVERWRAAA